MRFERLLIAGCLAVSLACPAFGDSIRVETQQGRRACGEETVFRVSLVDDRGALKKSGRGTVTLDNFGPQELLRESVDFAEGNPRIYRGTLKEPGFLRLSVDVKGVSRNLDDRPYMYSVPYEHERIVQGAPEPADFDAFWAKGAADLAAISLDARMTEEPRKSSAKWTMYRVSFASIGRRVNGWMSVPKTGKGPWPACVSVPGAGCDQPPNGAVDRVVLRLSVFPYELSLDSAANRRKFDELNAGYKAKYGVPRYPFAGMDVAPQEYFYHPVILGAARAVRWLSERPEVDRTQITYAGSSQGGAFGLYLAGLAGEVFKEVYSEVPALTDTLGWLKGRAGGWPHPELEWFGCDVKSRDARIAQVMPYFDCCNFAARAKCPVRIVAGLADWVCSPTAVCAAYNRMQGTNKKLVLAYGGTHHSAGRVAVEQEKRERSLPVVQGSMVDTSPANFMRRGIDAFRRGFADPPREVRPWTRWFWMNGNVSTNGITHDLEAMKALGLGGAMVMDQTWLGVPRGCVAPYSDGWFDFAVFAGQEADRLGLKLGFHNCPGFSSTGGPWVEPKDAQKVLRWTETRVSGGCRVVCNAPRPATPFGWFRDVATLAVPVRAGEEWFVVKAVPGDPSRFDFPEMRTVACAQLEVEPWVWKLPGYDFPLGLNAPKTRFAVFASEDGKTFREVARVPMTDEAPDHTVSFQPVRAKSVRIVPIDDAAAPRRWKRVSFSSVPRIPHGGRKSLRYYFRKCGASPLVPEDTLDCPLELAIRPEDVIDLGSRIDAEGNLDWVAPPGEWMVLRFAAVVQAEARNHPAGRGAEGLECDKLSRHGVEAGVSGTVRRMAERLKHAGVKAYEFAFVDSFEVPVQNWTEAFPDEFRRRRGYDLIRELPILTGRFVGSTEHSEKVLDDFRRTYADLFATYYNDVFAELVHGYGFRLMSQPYPGPFDSLRQARSTDVPSVEFWFRYSLNMCRLAGSLGNVYGRRVIAAESFTEAPPAATNLHNEVVADLRRRGDLMYSQGVNLFELHGTVHQPSDDPAKRLFFGLPGRQFGCSFDRHHPDYVTFGPWIAYLGRAQYLLQQGRGVADILYVQRGRSPEMPVWTPETPYGWKGDCIDPETFAEKGEMGYKVVVRPGATSAELREQIVRRCPQPDFAAMEGGRPVRENEVVFTHRACDWAEIYFVANQTDRPLSLDCRFRSTGECEEWDAWTGSCSVRNDVHPVEGGVTSVKLDLPTGASRFVIFLKSPPSSVKYLPKK